MLTIWFNFQLQKSDCNAILIGPINFVSIGVELLILINKIMVFSKSSCDTKDKFRFNLKADEIEYVNQ